MALNGGEPPQKIPEMIDDGETGDKKKDDGNDDGAIFSLNLEDCAFNTCLFLSCMCPLACLILGIILFRIGKAQLTQIEIGYVCHEPPFAAEVEFRQNNGIPVCLDAYHGERRINPAPLCLQQSTSSDNMAFEEAPPQWCY